jgi:hypothetical protein
VFADSHEVESQRVGPGALIQGRSVERAGWSSEAGSPEVEADGELHDWDPLQCGRRVTFGGHARHRWQRIGGRYYDTAVRRGGKAACETFVAGR